MPQKDLISYSEKLPTSYSKLLFSILSHSDREALKKLKEKLDEKEIHQRGGWTKISWDGKVLWQFCISEHKEELMGDLDKHKNHSKDHPARATAEKMGSQQALTQAQISNIILSVIRVRKYENGIIDFINNYVIYCIKKNPPIMPLAFEGHEEFIKSVEEKYKLNTKTAFKKKSQNQNTIKNRFTRISIILSIALVVTFSLFFSFKKNNTISNNKNQKTVSQIEKK